MTTLYRIKLIRWNTDVKEECREYCLRKDVNILACGWPASQNIERNNLEKYRQIVREMFHNPKELEKLSLIEQEERKKTQPYDNKSSWTTACNAIKEMKKGDLCWTQSKDGKYYLGEIQDEEIYFKDPKYPQIAMYKTCRWKSFELDAVPGRVITSLIGGRTLQRINDETILKYSKDLYEGKKQEQLELSKLLHPDDLEDLLGLYLQKEKGYFVFPSTNKTGTACYEYILVNKKGEKAIIQCKTGKAEIDDTQSLISNRDNITVYITTLAGKKEYPGAIVIPFKTLIEWAQKEENKKILPDRIRNYLDWSK